MSAGDGGPKVRAPVNHWVVALTVTLATFMEVLDTSIANVALRYIAGDLGIGASQSVWVLTSYLVANAIVLPLSGFFIGLVGRKYYYMSCVAIFTVSSALCGAAPNIGLLVIFRIMQGVGGGGLQPSEQGILIDTFPASLRGMALAIYGVAVVVAPILGPALGGYICDNYGWRWIFYINVPVGILSLCLTSIIVTDPPGMREAARENRRRGISVDYIGLSLVSLTLGSFEVLNAKGQEWDWYNDPSWWTQFFMVSFALGGVAFVWWELRHKDPIINLRLLGERNFLACGVMIFIAFAALYGANADTPQMLQERFGYDAYHAGLILSPSAIFTMAAMPIVGFLLGRRVDARYLLFFGLSLLATSSYLQTILTPQVSPWALIAPRCVQMTAVGFLFVPLNNAAYQYLPKPQLNNATGIFNVLRNEGGSLGIGIVTVMVDRRQQVHQMRIGSHLRPSNPMVEPTIRSYQDTLQQTIGTHPASSYRQALAEVYSGLQTQARIWSYYDMFYIFFILALVAIPFLFLMKRAVAEGDVELGG